jgi:ATP-dependent DNA helicase DinG
VSDLWVSRIDVPPAQLRRAALLRNNRRHANKPGTPMPDLLSPQPRSGGARAVLVAGFAEAAWLTPDGRVEALEPQTAARRALIEAPIVCHAPATFRKLKSQRAPVADILELYAFVRPASFCLPTPRGIALAMGLPLGDHAPLADQARRLAQAARALLGELAATTSKRRRISGLASLMAKAGWVWGPDALKALEAGGPLSAQAGVAVWEDLRNGRTRRPSRRRAIWRCSRPRRGGAWAICSAPMPSNARNRPTMPRR